MRMRSVAVIAALVGAIGFAKAQQPLSLDLSFRAQFDDWQVTSILPLEDGDVIISGQIKFAGDEYFRSGARLNNDGSRALGFAEVTYMGGKLTPWEDKVYAQNAIGVRRLYTDGSLDETFNMVNAPYFLALQGGDYHVYPDGRILMSGVHQVNYPDSNWVGFYNLIWFTSNGYLDTTRVPRAGDGVIYRFKELPDGKFMCTGPMSQYDGHPTSNIFRVHADGRLDTTFFTGVTWGQAFAYHPMADGKCVVGGLFRIAGNPDTLNLVRFLPDGSLDPTFNNGHRFNAPPPLSATYGGVVAAITPLDAGRLVVTGTFRNVDGISRGSICLIDTAGQLLDDHFSAGGCGPHTYQGFTDAAIQDIIITDSVCYIWGDYHGYDDGTTNDPLQRFVTRLYGPDFSMRAHHEPATAGHTLTVTPNPASTWISLSFNTNNQGDAAALEIRDLTGRAVHRTILTGAEGQVIWDCRSILSGTYTAVLFAGSGETMAVCRLLIAR